MHDVVGISPKTPALPLLQPRVASAAAVAAVAVAASATGAIVFFLLLHTRMRQANAQKTLCVW